MDDFYFTFANQVTEEIKIKGSRFIGRTFCVQSMDEINKILTEIRKKEYTASHNCYVWITGQSERTFKYSDDGEPSGTAGKPIYDVINGADLTNVLVIVTRYFGGTKLGTGGLVKAYGGSAKSALEKAGIEKIYLKDRFKIEIEFSLYNQVLKLIEKFKVTVIESDFSDRVKLILEVRKSKTDLLKDALIDLSGGKVKIE